MAGPGTVGRQDGRSGGEKDTVLHAGTDMEELMHLQ